MARPNISPLVALFLIVFIVSGATAVMAHKEVGIFAPKCGKLTSYNVAAIENVTFHDGEMRRTLGPNDTFDGDIGLNISGIIQNANDDCIVMALTREVELMETSTGNDSPVIDEPVEFRQVLHSSVPVNEGFFDFRVRYVGMDADYGDSTTIEPHPLSADHSVVTTAFDLELVLVDERCLADIHSKSLAQGFAYGYPESCELVVSTPLKAQRLYLN